MLPQNRMIRFRLTEFLKRQQRSYRPDIERMFPKWPCKKLLGILKLYPSGRGQPGSTWSRREHDERSVSEQVGHPLRADLVASRPWIAFHQLVAVEPNYEYDE